jgi:type II secretory pathway component PulM
MIKEKWLDLSMREKQTVSIGAFFLIFFLVYYFLWSPMTTKVDNLKNQVEQNKKLLIWMRDAHQKIQFLEKNHTPSHAKTTGSLLSILQNAIQQSDIEKNLSGMQQKEQNSVQLTFKEVDFDQLMTWLIKNSSEGWTISEFSITKTSNPGMVSAVFQLRL